MDSEIPPIKSVPVVSVFLEFFPNDLLDIIPKREIGFGIDLIPKTNPISIPQYKISPAELKELKAQLKDFIYKA